MKPVVVLGEFVSRVMINRMYGRKRKPVSECFNEPGVLHVIADKHRKKIINSIVKIKHKKREIPTSDCQT